MDTALWLGHLQLPLRWQRRWILSHRDRGRVERGALEALEAMTTRRGLRDFGEQLLARCEAAGIAVVTPLDRAWPTRLAALADPPGALFLRGAHRELGHRHAIGVVGARRGTARGRRVSEEIGRCVAAVGLPVVSGLALGVDGASHRGCLDVGGRAIAVLATGVDLCHPPSHRSLHAQVAEQGVLVSEYPPGTPPARMRFVARNRILAALCSHLVVVEASARSGALSTVGFAQDLGIEVAVVPGPVDCPFSEGTMQLLVDGATPVRHGGDVLDWAGYARPLPSSAPLGLTGQPRRPEEIAAEQGLSLGETLSRLTRAELAGTVRRLPGDRWIAGGTSADLRGDEERS